MTTYISRSYVDSAKYTVTESKNCNRPGYVDDCKAVPRSVFNRLLSFDEINILNVLYLN